MINKPIQENMHASIIKYKQKLAMMTDKELADRFEDFDEKKLRQLAWSHGLGNMSSHYLDRVQNARTNELDLKKTQIDSKKWTDTAPNKNRYYSITKYSFVLVLFITSLLLISAAKNQTRKLQKEINILTTSNDKIKFSLKQAILDNEVLTSPENIALLANKHLNSSFVVYKKSQIKNLGKENEDVIPDKKNKNLSHDVKEKVKKKIKSTKVEIMKLKEFYSTPEDIPKELRSTIARRIENKKIQLKKLYDSYDSPGQVLASPKAQRWVSIQLVKLFLGFPTIPGK